MVTLLLNQNDIPSLTSFDGNIDADKMNPYIYLAQRHDLKKALGTALYDKIYADYVSDSLTGVYKTIYDEFVVDMLVFFSCSKYMSLGGTKTNNNGSYKTQFSGSVLLDSKELARQISNYDQLATSAETLFYEYMADPDTPDVPEYKADTDDPEENKVIPWH